MYNTKKKNARFGRYPSCDMVNNAIRSIISGNYNVAIDELYFAIQKSEGYLHEDIAEKVEQIHKSVTERRISNSQELTEQCDYVVYEPDYGAWRVRFKEGNHEVN